MKKEEMKELVKEAVLEALTEYSNYGAAADDGVELSLGDIKDKDKDDTPGRPGPLIGPSGFSLR